MLLLLDIGNTHTHVAWTKGTGISRQREILTASWFEETAGDQLQKLLGKQIPTAAALCSVVPGATTLARNLIHDRWKLPTFELTHLTVSPLGINYPRPATIGPDRLANALAAFTLFPTPVVVVDFGTAVTFDVVDQSGSYAGGIIAPGLSAMTDYLHEKTALLPRIKLKNISGWIGKSTEQAMLIGAVHGYRGLIRELIAGLGKALKAEKLTVLATGGYASLMVDALPGIDRVMPNLTLEGLRIAWENQHSQQKTPIRQDRR